MVDNAKLDLVIQPRERSHVQIERFVRSQIQNGKLLPGERLPATSILARRWHVDCTTIQKAMTRLAEQNLLDRIPNRGTFVKSSTETATIGVMFGPDLALETSHFFRALFRALQADARGRHWVCRAYSGLNQPDGRPQSPEAPVYQQLAHDLRNHAFRGMIECASGLYRFQHVEYQDRLPRVLFEPHQPDTDFKHDHHHFARESVKFLASHGRRRIFYLRTRWPRDRQSEDLDGLWDAVRELNLPQPQIESIVTTEQGAQTEREVYRRILERVRDWRSLADRKERPDAILLGDDMATRAVALALIQSGIRVPEEVLVMAQTTAEVDLHYGIPVARYELSVRQIAREFLDLLWKRILGQSLPPRPILIRGQVKEEDG